MIDVLLILAWLLLFVLFGFGVSVFRDDDEMAEVCGYFGLIILGLMTFIMFLSSALDAMGW